MIDVQAAPATGQAAAVPTVHAAVSLGKMRDGENSAARVRQAGAGCAGAGDQDQPGGTYQDPANRRPTVAELMALADWLNTNTR